MRLTEQEFTARLATPCACGAQSFVIRAYVAMRQPLLEGEPYGTYSWAYKGEELVHGVFSIACGACKKVSFEDGACPRCDAPGGLEIALEAENTFPVPKACASCGSARVSLVSYVPIKVAYKGTRAEKARTTMVPEDPGFHAFRVECKACPTVLERRAPCPVCAHA